MMALHTNFLSIKNTVLFHYLNPSTARGSCTIEDICFYDIGVIKTYAEHPGNVSLILPDEIEMLNSETFPDKKIFYVKTTVPELHNKYKYFAVLEYNLNGRHYASICSAGIETGVVEKVRNNRGLLSTEILLAQAMLFLILCIVFLYRQNNTGFGYTIIKYASRMFFVVVCYCLLKNADSLSSANP